MKKLLHLYLLLVLILIIFSPKFIYAQQLLCQKPSGPWDSYCTNVTLTTHSHSYGPQLECILKAQCLIDKNNSKSKRNSAYFRWYASTGTPDLQNCHGELWSNALNCE